MRYPLVPLVNELTFPLLFFWFCLPFVMLLIIAIIWLQVLLNEGNDCCFSTRPSTVSTNALNYILTSKTRHITKSLHTSIFTE
uniref:Adipogenin n=1 Tax=Ficedula albicollis TaxID=59894 RepID=A0A803V7F1_FICAL